MRRSIASVTLLLASCASAPIDGWPTEVVGHYRMQNGPDIWDELELMPNGLCTWWSCRAVGWLYRTPTPGHWRVERDRIVLELDGAAAPRLSIRRWKEHVYLVPGRHLDWFDQHGPDEEFCFHADGAPLQEPPWLPDTTRSGSR